MSLILETLEDVGASGTGSYPGIYISHSISPYSRPFSVSIGGGTVTVTYNVDFEIFPLQYVDYVNTAGSLVRIPGINAMDLLPDPSAAPHLAKMREDTKSSVTFTITIQSYSVEDDGEGNSYTVNYTMSHTMIINANYNTNRDKVVSAVNARRS